MFNFIRKIRDNSRKAKIRNYLEPFLKERFEKYDIDNDQLIQSLRESDLKEKNKTEIESLLSDYFKGLNFLCKKVLEANIDKEDIDAKSINECMPYMGVTAFTAGRGTRGFPLKGYNSKSIFEQLGKEWELEDNVNQLYSDTYPEVLHSQITGNNTNIQATSIRSSPHPNEEEKIKTIAAQWSFVFSDKFFKSINKIDRKLQSRIWDALVTLKDKPTTLLGNTVKPLVSNPNLKGLWRYRIGDYRIIYAPVETDRKILFLKFTSRSEAYKA